MSSCYLNVKFVNIWFSKFKISVKLHNGSIQIMWSKHNVVYNNNIYIIKHDEKHESLCTFKVAYEYLEHTVHSFLTWSVFLFRTK